MQKPEWLASSIFIRPHPGMSESTLSAPPSCPGLGLVLRLGLLSFSGPGSDSEPFFPIPGLLMDPVKFSTISPSALVNEPSKSLYFSIAGESSSMVRERFSLEFAIIFAKVTVPLREHLRSGPDIFICWMFSVSFFREELRTIDENLMRGREIFMPSAEGISTSFSFRVVFSKKVFMFPDSIELPSGLNFNS